MRSHYSDQIDRSLIGKELAVAGWLHRRRDHGGVIFVDLRDREGLLQVVFDPDDPEMFAQAERLRGEYVIAVQGVLRVRPEGTINPELPTGEFELVAKELTVLNQSKTPPFHHEEKASEETRLRYRYLDLRGEVMQRNLRLRHAITKTIRNFLDESGFFEIEGFVNKDQGINKVIINYDGNDEEMILGSDGSFNGSLQIENSLDVRITTYKNEKQIGKALVFKVEVE